MGSRPREIQLGPALIAPLVILALSLFGASPAAHAQPRPKECRPGSIMVCISLLPYESIRGTP
jgi:hypothetical protein